jgi:hypothetical protein
VRTIKDSTGTGWTARIVSHGKTSGYLSRKVHRPVVQFTGAGPGQVRRYAPLPPDVGSLEDLDDERLLHLLEQARAH